MAGSNHGMSDSPNRRILIARGVALALGATRPGLAGAITTRKTRLGAPPTDFLKLSLRMCWNLYQLDMDARHLRPKSHQGALYACEKIIHTFWLALWKVAGVLCTVPFIGYFRCRPKNEMSFSEVFRTSASCSGLFWDRNPRPPPAPSSRPQ